VLSPQNTTFVIITSDQDFRHHFQLLRSMNYTIIVIHSAPESSQWSATMAMHCSSSYHWKEVLAGAAVDQGSELGAPLPAEGRRKQNRPKEVDNPGGQKCNGGHRSEFFSEADEPRTYVSCQ
jgi:hypothetical protein